MTKRDAGAKANRPEVEAADAVVRQHDEAIFGPEQSGFASNRTFAPSDMVARVRAIDWFVHCGESRDFDLTMPVDHVKTWSHAIQSLKSRARQDATLQARNQLTVYLSQNHRERYREWNRITDTIKQDVVAPLKENIWEPFRQSHGLDIVFLHSVEWMILAVLMENAYVDCKHACFFFHELLMVYEAGHLPCGWIGKWPQGTLVVY